MKRKNKTISRIGKTVPRKLHSRLGLGTSEL